MKKKKALLVGFILTLFLAAGLLVSNDGLFAAGVKPALTGSKQAGMKVLSLPVVQPEKAAAGGNWLSLDDGTVDNNIGIGGTMEFLWVNRFTPPAADFPFNISKVQIWFSTVGLVNVGDAIRIVVYENTSGNNDPAVGANFLYQYDTTVQAVDAWSTYDLPAPVAFSGPGDVIVGAIALRVPGSSYWPAAIDQTATQSRSWAGWWNASPPPATPTLPPNDTWTLIDSYFPGNWMIRAYYTTGAAGSISVSDSAVDFGNTLIFSSKSQTITVTNSGTGNLNVGAITLENVVATDFTLANDAVSNTTIAAGQSATFDIVFRPGRVGVTTARVNIASDDPANPNVYIDLTGSGFFVPAADDHRCFIATAAFGSPAAGQVEILRHFRDKYLLTSAPGKKFVAWYYKNSPAAAKFIQGNPLAKAAVQACLYPLIGFSFLLLSGYLPLVAAGLLLAAVLFFRIRHRSPAPE